MVVLLRLSHLQGLLRSGVRISASTSYNPATGVEKVRLIVHHDDILPIHAQRTTALILDMLAASCETHCVADRGHRHSKMTRSQLAGCSDIAFYITQRPDLAPTGSAPSSTLPLKSILKKVPQGSGADERPQRSLRFQGSPLGLEGSAEGFNGAGGKGGGKGEGGLQQAAKKPQPVEQPLQQPPPEVARLRKRMDAHPAIDPANTEELAQDQFYQQEQDARISAVEGLIADGMRFSASSITMIVEEIDNIDARRTALRPIQVQLTGATERLQSVRAFLKTENDTLIQVVQRVETAQSRTIEIEREVSELKKVQQERQARAAAAVSSSAAEMFSCPGVR
eukprot:TRINITY_DN3110_c0_g1_i1.p1 TRINITY_DN3110_c0_g1~~TRINITY_DN3110_c0_g1_i1.p1  ORF type:complete len:338 (-),score=35.96 TRINITY_DN3110_c0_g1_i1:333-1346(-)